MKALPFPCIRPAQDRVLEALPQMGGILSSNDALRDAIADGLILKDPGAAYYVYECSGEPGRVTGVVAICPVGVLAGDGATPAGATAAARAIAELNNNSERNSRLVISCKYQRCLTCCVINPILIALCKSCVLSPVRFIAHCFSQL